MQDAVSISAVQKRLEEQNKVIEKLQAQVDQLTPAYATVLRREPTLKLSEQTREDSKAMKRLKDEGLIPEK